MNMRLSSSAALRIAVVSTTLMASSSALSQVRGCQISDTECVEQRIVQHCRALTATAADCLSWIEDLESSSPPDSIDAVIAQANSYYSLAELAARQQSLDNEDEIERYFKTSRDLYQAAHDQNNSNLDALHGLAATSQSTEENTHWLREIAAENPTDSIAIRGLADRLAASGSSGALEASRLKMDAYNATESSSKKWSLAQSALEILEQAGLEAEYDAFRQRVLSDLDMSNIESEFHDYINTKNVSDLQARLATPCDASVIQMFGAAPCDALVMLILTMSESFDASERVEVLDYTAEMAKNIFGNTSFNSISEWYGELRSHLQLNFIAVGTDSAGIYSLNEVITRDNPAESILSAQKAVELAPDNGQYRMILGQKYLSQGDADEALAQFDHAKALLPDYMKTILDSMIVSAQTLRDSDGATRPP